MSRLTPTGLAPLVQPSIADNPFMRPSRELASVQEITPGIYRPNAEYQADARSIIDSVMMDDQAKSRALSALLARAGGPALSPGIQQEYAAERAAQQQAASQSRRILDLQKKSDAALIEAKTREYNRAHALLSAQGGTAEQFQELEGQFTASLYGGLSQPNPILQAQAEDDEENPAKKLARRAQIFSKRWGTVMRQHGITEDEVAASLWFDKDNPTKIEGEAELKELLGIREPTPADIRAQEVQAFKAIDEAAAAAEAGGETVDPRDVFAAKTRARDAIRGTSSYVAPRQGFDDDPIYPDPVTVYPDFSTATEALIGSLGGAAVPSTPGPALSSAPTASPTLQASQRVSAQTQLPIMVDNDDRARIIGEAQARGAREVSFIFNGRVVTLPLVQ